MLEEEEGRSGVLKDCKPSHLQVMLLQTIETSTVGMERKPSAAEARMEGRKSGGGSMVG